MLREPRLLGLKDDMEFIFLLPPPNPNNILKNETPIETKRIGINTLLNNDND